jgi:hypothetical protein
MTRRTAEDEAWGRGDITCMVERKDSYKLLSDILKVSLLKDIGLHGKMISSGS